MTITPPSCLRRCMRVLSCGRAPRRGFTLTEMAIVLGIIGLILGAIWVAAASAYENLKVKTAEEETAFILSNYRGLFAARGIDTAVGTTTDITCGAAGGINGVNDGFFPGPMGGAGCVAGTNATYPQDPWGGPVLVWADQSNQAIAIDFTGLPLSACIKYAMQIPNTPDIIQVQIQGAMFGTGTFTTPPVTLNFASSLCRPAMAGGTAAVTVWYKVR